VNRVFESPEKTLEIQAGRSLALTTAGSTICRGGIYAALERPIGRRVTRAGYIPPLHKAASSR